VVLKVLQLVLQRPECTDLESQAVCTDIQWFLWEISRPSGSLWTVLSKLSSSCIRLRHRYGTVTKTVPVVQLLAQSLQPTIPLSFPLVPDTIANVTRPQQLWPMTLDHQSQCQRVILTHTSEHEQKCVSTRQCEPLPWLFCYCFTVTIAADSTPQSKLRGS
jgi:hypothetical protein